VFYRQFAFPTLSKQQRQMLSRIHKTKCNATAFPTFDFCLTGQTFCSYSRSSHDYIIVIRLRSDYDTTTTYRAHLLPLDACKKWRCQFFIVVVSQSNRTTTTHLTMTKVIESNAYRNFDHFRCSQMRRGIVVSQLNHNYDIGFRPVPKAEGFWKLVKRTKTNLIKW